MNSSQAPLSHFNSKSFSMTSQPPLSKDRKQREADALRSNLQRRKEQSRARVKKPDDSSSYPSLQS